MKIVFLLEEPSAAKFLEAYVPRWRPDLEFLCIPHEGKSDLEKSIPRKIRAWQDPEARFVILRDNDGADCTVIKERLKSLVGDERSTLIRIACQELEAWYLGDLSAVGTAYQNQSLAGLQGKSKFREPDRLVSPSTELGKLVPYRKLRGSALLGENLGLDLASNRSSSFRVFFEGLKRLLSA